MPTRHTAELPDRVYGSADTTPSSPQRLTAIALEGPHTHGMIAAHFGGLFIAMSERNWQTLFNAVEQVDIPVDAPTRRITFNDTDRAVDIRLVPSEDVNA